MGTALVAAVVSLAVSFIFRDWEARRVRWLLTGKFHPQDDPSMADERQVANIWFHNVGDGDAFGGITTRLNNAGYESWDQFELARISSGESLHVEMRPSIEGWETASIALTWEDSPTGRSKKHTYGPVLLHEVLHDTTGKGAEFRERESRRLRRPGESD